MHMQHALLIAHLDIDNIAGGIQIPEQIELDRLAQASAFE